MQTDTTVKKDIERRWSMERSPLKISYWTGSPNCPTEVKEKLRGPLENAGWDELEILERLWRHEVCILLTFDEALAILHRVKDLSVYHFHPQDHDWQIDGWRIGDVSRLLAPLTKEDLFGVRHWPLLPEHPTPAEIFAEVMIQYSMDIDKMELQKPQLFEALAFERRQWLQPAVAYITRGGTPMVNGTWRMNGRLLWKRVYEIEATGQSNIDPVEGEIQFSCSQQKDMEYLMRKQATTN